MVNVLLRLCLMFFFFNDTATTEIYTLSLHDALPIYPAPGSRLRHDQVLRRPDPGRSEEHTSELQSRVDLVCRLLLEKKKTIIHLCISDKEKKTNYINSQCKPTR